MYTYEEVQNLRTEEGMPITLESVVKYCKNYEKSNDAAGTRTGCQICAKRDTSTTCYEPKFIRKKN